MMATQISGLFPRLLTLAYSGGGVCIIVVATAVGRRRWELAFILRCQPIERLG